MIIAELAGFSKPYFIVTWVELGVSIIFLSARCYTAFYILHHVANDLYLALATFALGIGSMSMITAGAAKGLGVSEVDLILEERRYALLYGWISQFLALIAIGMGKVTIVLFLEQIQGYRTRLRTFTLWSLAGSNLAVNFVAAMLALVQCEPPRRLWDEDIPGVCPGRKREQIFGYIQGSWSAFCDFALALYPTLLFAQVHAFSIVTRVGLCILMGFGIVAGACTIVKTVQLSLLTKPENATVTLANIILWNETEMWVVFIVSCIPPTKIFFQRAISFTFKNITGCISLIQSSGYSQEAASDPTP